MQVPLSPWSKGERPLRLRLNSGTGFGANRKMLVDVLAQQRHCRNVTVTKSYNRAIVETGSGTYAPICLNAIQTQPRSCPKLIATGAFILPGPRHVELGGPRKRANSSGADGHHIFFRKDQLGDPLPVAAHLSCLIQASVM
jgi:hypothetical protein